MQEKRKEDQKTHYMCDLLWHNNAILHQYFFKEKYQAPMYEEAFAKRDTRSGKEILQQLIVGLEGDAMDGETD